MAYIVYVTNMKKPKSEIPYDELILRLKQLLGESNSSKSSLIRQPNTEKMTRDEWLLSVINGIWSGRICGEFTIKLGGEQLNKRDRIKQEFVYAPRRKK